ncbi:class I SAM-dependent methyltransferase [Micromonospora sp. BRA006-A]|nr:class I SAM-dependent methyltransferase [Micromonospora sp. BRA006-A]
MPDAIFAHPRLAPVYDAFDGDREDLAAYLAIADELDARMVLDVGCGTGCLAVQLARHGRTVVGVDPARASLAVARSKDPEGRVSWIHGDATALPPLRADLAAMTSNVAQVFLSDDDWAAPCGRARRAAARRASRVRDPPSRAPRVGGVGGGHRAGDPGRAGRRAGAAAPRRHRRRPAVRVLPVHVPVPARRHGPHLGLPLRFRDRDEVEASLAAAGYRVLDVREAPDRPGREFVFVAQRST